MAAALKQTTPYLSPAVVGTQSSEVSAGFSFYLYSSCSGSKEICKCRSVLCGLFNRNSRWKCYLCKCQGPNLEAPWWNGTHLPATASVGSLIKGKFLSYKFSSLKRYYQFAVIQGVVLLV